ncbi:large subunit GTPase 1 homolog [Dermatophagoides farinae]|uniref:Large subunit GTPase 1 homolog n=1 Tax=Dermatophagoides farinae TaxID=6954 RepID=A0A922KZV3_DERFA|nr:large subunit GTPase 1 [Dermatophagoides farinae]
MVKSQANLSLGRSLIKSQRNQSTSGPLSERHSHDELIVEKSVTENTSLDDFLAQTRLANKQFTAEQETNIRIVDTNDGRTAASSDEDFRDQLLIPRRPQLDQVDSPQRLKELENENYLKWRRHLAHIQETTDVVLTPFEKNLEFWRQLWRVIERSDVLVQILDARNPLLFYSADLDKYIGEVDPDKRSLILLNKADYLNREQRQHWLDHFDSMDIQCLFFSALEQQQQQEQPDSNEKQDISSVQMDQLQLKDRDRTLSLDYRQLISLLKSYRTDKRPLTVGLVGFPNVGKSSTINALIMKAKKVSVSATPGKTKHFQTIIIDDQLTICDCPGLVLPNLVSNKAELIINGILPIDQIKNVFLAIEAITSKVPAAVFESIYAMILLKKTNTTENSEDSVDEHVSSLELLTVYGYSRGFMTQRGLPDTSKAAKYILKDFVQGRILYCYAPPNVDQKQYHRFAVPDRIVNRGRQQIADRKLQRVYEGNNLLTRQDFDQEFFSHTSTSGVHVKDSKHSNAPDNQPAKPWKNHQHKRNRKQKLRRVYGHLDN